ncbi:MAG: formyltransferase family protein [Chloroflexota bacterium]
MLIAVQSAIEARHLDAQIIFVFSSRGRGESKDGDLFLDLVASYHIPLVCLPYQKFRAIHEDEVPAVGQPLPQWRLSYDRRAMEMLQGYNADVCLLAGYMLIVGEEMCRRYRMVNLHPALPCGPTGTWQEVIWKLMETRAGSTGAMMHLVTPELDRGPVVTYCNFSIRGPGFDRHWREVETLSVASIKRTQGERNALFQLIRAHGVARELPLVVSTLRALSEGRVKISNGKVLNSGGQPVAGHDLTGEIDEAVKDVLQ